MSAAAGEGGEGGRGFGRSPDFDRNLGKMVELLRRLGWKDPTGEGAERPGNTAVPLPPIRDALRKAFENADQAKLAEVLGCLEEKIEGEGGAGGGGGGGGGMAELKKSSTTEAAVGAVESGKRVAEAAERKSQHAEEEYRKMHQISSRLFDGSIMASSAVAAYVAPLTAFTASLISRASQMRKGVGLEIHMKNTINEIDIIIKDIRRRLGEEIPVVRSGLGPVFELLRYLNDCVIELIETTPRDSVEAEKISGACRVATNELVALTLEHYAAIKKNIAEVFTGPQKDELTQLSDNFNHALEDINIFVGELIAGARVSAEVVAQLIPRIVIDARKKIIERLRLSSESKFEELKEHFRELLKVDQKAAAGGDAVDVMEGGAEGGDKAPTAGSKRAATGKSTAGSKRPREEGDAAAGGGGSGDKAAAAGGGGDNKAATGKALAEDGSAPAAKKGRVGAAAGKAAGGSGAAGSGGAGEERGGKRKTRRRRSTSRRSTSRRRSRRRSSNKKQKASLSKMYRKSRSRRSRSQGRKNKRS